MSDQPVLRWGILGAANIARKNWKAILNSDNLVVAVASRDSERCRQFVAQCQAAAPMPTTPKAIGSYEELIASKDVDAVYIPLPTGLRKEWVLRAAKAGKHVLCEKPCAVSVADLEEMLETCRANNVQFMDGVMFMHSHRLAQLRHTLDDGVSIGQIRRMASAFSFGAPPEFFAANIRGDARLEPHGCVGDLGWYCIRFALWVMNWQMPREVTGRILSRAPGNPKSGVPAEFSAELVFENGVSASFYCAFVTDNQEWVNISGTKGYLEVPDFVLPFAGPEIGFEINHPAFCANGCDFEMKTQPRRVKVAEYSHSHFSAQESNMFRNFADQVLSGRLNDAWPEMALKTQQVMAACLNAAK